MDFSSGGKRLSGFLKWWLLAEWIIREVVIRKVEMIRRANILCNPNPREELGFGSVPGPVDRTKG